MADKIDFKKKFSFGDKVIDRVDERKLIVVKKTRGHRHIVLDKKGVFWETNTGRLNLSNWQEKTL